MDAYKHNDYLLDLLAEQVKEYRQLAAEMREIADWLSEDSTTQRVVYPKLHGESSEK